MRLLYSYKVTDCLLVRENWSDDQKLSILFNLSIIGELFNKLELDYFKDFEGKDLKKFHERTANFHDLRKSFHTLRNYIVHQAIYCFMYKDKCEKVKNDNYDQKLTLIDKTKTKRQYQFTYRETFRYCLQKENLVQVLLISRIPIKD